MYVSPSFPPIRPFLPLSLPRCFLSSFSLWLFLLSSSSFRLSQITSQQGQQHFHSFATWLLFAMYVFVPNIPSSIRPSLVLTLLDSFSSLPLTLSTHLNLLHSPLPHSQQHPFHSFSQLIVYSIHYYFFQKETFPAIFWFRRLNNKRIRRNGGKREENEWVKGKLKISEEVENIEISR